MGARNRSGREDIQRRHVAQDRRKHGHTGRTEMVVNFFQMEPFLPKKLLLNGSL